MILRITTAIAAAAIACGLALVMCEYVPPFSGHFDLDTTHLLALIAGFLAFIVNAVRRQTLDILTMIVFLALLGTLLLPPGMSPPRELLIAMILAGGACIGAAWWHLMPGKN